MARKRKPAPTKAETFNKGLRAQRELELTTEAFEDVRQYLLEAIAKTPMDAAPQRERLYLSVQLLGPVRDMLIAAVNDGVAVEHETNVQKIMGA